MNKEQVKNRIDKLKKEINHHRYLYHVLDKQEISDAALDSLKHELDILEKEFPDLITSDMEMTDPALVVRQNAASCLGRMCFKQAIMSSIMH